MHQRQRQKIFDDLMAIIEPFALDEGQKRQWAASTASQIAALPEIVRPVRHAPSKAKKQRPPKRERMHATFGTSHRLVTTPSNPQPHSLQVPTVDLPH